jgi:hypothetical protein
LAVSFLLGPGSSGVALFWPGDGLPLAAPPVALAETPPPDPLLPAGGGAAAKLQNRLVDPPVVVMVPEVEFSPDPPEPPEPPEVPGGAPIVESTPAGSKSG